MVEDEFENVHREIRVKNSEVNEEYTKKPVFERKNFDKLEKDRKALLKSMNDE